MPSPPRSLEEAVERAARQTALIPPGIEGHDAVVWAEKWTVVREMLEAAGLPALLERLQEVERERDNADAAAEHARSWNASCTQRAESAEARVASLERALKFYANPRNHNGVGISLVYNDRGRVAREALGGECRDCYGRGRRWDKKRNREVPCGTCGERGFLAQVAAAPLPGDTG